MPPPPYKKGVVNSKFLLNYIKCFQNEFLSTTYVDDFVDDDMVNESDDDKQTAVKSVMIQRNYVSLVLWDFMERGTFSIQIFCEFYIPIS